MGGSHLSFVISHLSLATCHQGWRTLDLRYYVSRRLPCGFTFYVSLLFLLATATFSLANWFTQRDFQKDDFRATAQFVRERMAADLVRRGVLAHESGLQLRTG